MTLIEILEHDVGAHVGAQVVRASCLAAFQLLATAKQCRGILKAILQRHLCDVENICRLVAERIPAQNTWTAAYLPPWEVLMRAGKSYSFIEWSCLKPAFGKAVQRLLQLPHAPCMALMTDCSPIQVLQLRHALIHATEHLGTCVAAKVNLQAFPNESPAHLFDRLQLRDAIHDWARLPLTAPHLTLAKTIGEECDGTVPPLQEALRAALSSECARMSLHELGSALLTTVQKASNHPCLDVSSAVVDARRRALAYNSRRQLLLAAEAVLKARVAPRWRVYTDADNAIAAESEAAEAEAEAEAEAALLEEEPLAAFLNVCHTPRAPLSKPSSLQSELRLGRAFLRGPNRSRVLAGLFEVYLALRRMEQAEAAAERDGGADLAQMLSTAGRELLSRSPPPLRLALQQVQDLPAADAVAAAHACGPSCGLTVPLARALRVELRHLYENCAGSGVSAVPAGESATSLLE